jgi:uncharacterized membrane protein
MFRMVGGSLGVAITGAIFQASVGGATFETATPQQFVDGLSSAMWVSASVTVLGAVIAAVAITVRPKGVGVAVAEAEASPGGEELAGVAT